MCKDPGVPGDGQGRIAQEVQLSSSKGIDTEMQNDFPKV